MAPPTFRYRLATIAACCISTRTRWMIVSKVGGWKENGVWRDLGPHTVFSFQKREGLRASSNYNRSSDWSRRYIGHYSLNSGGVHPIGGVDDLDAQRFQRIETLQALAVEIDENRLLRNRAAADRAGRGRTQPVGS